MPLATEMPIERRAFGARAGRQHQRQHAEDEGEGRHQDRPAQQPADDGLRSGSAPRSDVAGIISAAQRLLPRRARGPHHDDAKRGEKRLFERRRQRLVQTAADRGRNCGFGEFRDLRLHGAAQIGRDLQRRERGLDPLAERRDRQRAEHATANPGDPRDRIVDARRRARIAPIDRPHHGRGERATLIVMPIPSTAIAGKKVAQ